MPESKVRKKAAYSGRSGSAVKKPNSRWFLPAMLTVLLLGLAWVVTFYVSQGSFPVAAWGNWNILAGFGILVIGLIMATRWR